MRLAHLTGRLRSGSQTLAMRAVAGSTAGADGTSAASGGERKGRRWGRWLVIFFSYSECRRYVSGNPVTTNVLVLAGFTVTHWVFLRREGERRKGG
jgi:hypothetical protein